MADYEFDLSELDSEADYSERAPKRPSSQPSFKPRPSPGTPAGVTQAQLEAALTRVDGKIKTVADGVATINSRLASIASATKKEVEERKKNLDNTNKDLNSKLMMLAILPALVQPTFTVPAVQIPAGTPLGLTGAAAGDIVSPAAAVPLQFTGATGTGSIDVSADSNTLNTLLPLLAVAGGGMGFGGDSSSGSDTNTMMMLALVLALGANSLH
jgi:hypothetical protein